MNKKPEILLFVLFILLVHSVGAQTVNWAGLGDQTRHVISVNVGVEYGVVFGVGYSRKVGLGRFPALIGLDCSVPSGNDLLDDYKFRLGGQLRLAEYRNFSLSTRLKGIFRHYKNDLVSMSNVGAEGAVTLGYYKSRWFLALDATYDRAFATYLWHSAAFRANYYEVKDGWYGPSTGGNFLFGLQTGISTGNHEISLKAGKILSQDLNGKPLIPAYIQLGYNLNL